MDGIDFIKTEVNKVVEKKDLNNDALAEKVFKATIYFEE